VKSFALNMRIEPALIGLCIAAAAFEASSAAEGDPRLIGRWCSKEITLYLADGTSSTSLSNDSQYTAQTFSDHRVFVDWVRLPQLARWTQSYAVVAPGQIAVKTLEHSSIPSLIGTIAVVRYEIQDATLKLTSYPQELKPEPMSSHRKVESTWVRCP